MYARSLPSSASALLLPLLLLLGGSAAALGINCRGSSLCVANIESNLNGVQAAVNAVSPGNMFQTGQHIACAGNLCAFFQDGASGNASVAAGFVQQIIEHGCKHCGSVPVMSGNNVRTGELTVNWVSHP